MQARPAASSDGGSAVVPTRARRFAVALSYAGESLDYIKKVVYSLRHSGLSRDEIFFDKYLDADWGPLISIPS